MRIENKNDIEVRISEIERLLKDFNEKFKVGTSDSENFLTMNEIERMWGELRSRTDNIYSDMLCELLSSVDESDLIRKKKREYKEKGIKLKTDKRYTKSILSTNGKLCFSRYLLRPIGKEAAQKLYDAEGIKAVAPLDCFLGIANLPFKMTVGAMLCVAYWAQNQCSYQRAEEALEKAVCLFVNDDTVRLVANYIGSLVFNEDCRRAEEYTANLLSGKVPFTHSKKGVLYIETDGAALNTRQKDNDGSTWRENKLGIVFSSDNIYSWIDKQGCRQRQLRKREYVSYIGSASEFRKHLIACAIRNGYGLYRETVILSDGATWIRNMAEEVFPDAQQILDFFHLSENVHEYAKYYFKMDESKSRTWAEKTCLALRDSKYAGVLQELKTHDKGHMDKCPVNLYGYITNNINNIDYASYEEKGYFIGSGAIESGNKVVMQQRLKQAGMRWNVETAQNLLTLKSKSESCLWHIDVEGFVLRLLRAKC